MMDIQLQPRREVSSAGSVGGAVQVMQDRYLAGPLQPVSAGLGQNGGHSLYESVLQQLLSHSREQSVIRLHFPFSFDQTALC